MKLLILLSLVILTSCETVKIVQVKSDQLAETGNNYVFEDDSIKITYRFWDNNGRMEYDVYNKMNTPMYIDWKTSAYIPNDRMVSYWRDETNTEAVSSGYYYRGVGLLSSGKAKAVRMERIAVIPPQSMITQNSFMLLKSFLDIPNDGSFDKISSPFKFRNYINIAGNEKFEGNVRAITNSFYVSQIKSIKKGKLESSKNETWFYAPIDINNPKYASSQTNNNPAPKPENKKKKAKK